MHCRFAPNQGRTSLCCLYVAVYGSWLLCVTRSTHTRMGELTVWIVFPTFAIRMYSKTSLNRTLLFQKVVRFSKISVYTKCRIAPANRKKFGLGGGFSDVSGRSSKPRQVRISARAVERGDASKWTCKPNMKALKLQANPNIVQIAPRLTEICSVYVKARK